ncbi:hypothetical protein HK096_008314, partial [Nowakowskiella sp. JEL0078]
MHSYQQSTNFEESIVEDMWEDDDQDSAVSANIPAHVLTTSLEKRKLGKNGGAYVSIYILNQCPSSATEPQLPLIKLFMEKKPNLSNLQVFSCDAYAFVPEDLQTGKEKGRGRRLIFCGYLEY